VTPNDLNRPLPALIASVDAMRLSRVLRKFKVDRDAGPEAMFEQCRDLLEKESDNRWTLERFERALDRVCEKAEA